MEPNISPACGAMTHIVSLFLLISFCTFIQGVPTDSPPLVKTRNGFVLGIKDTSVKGRPFNSFRAVPFAQPPLGNLRFRPPVPVNNWDGTLNATNYANMCAQSGVGSEDCLYLNVFTPKLPDRDSDCDHDGLPVLVFIYGGAFLTGSTQFYGPQRLMDQQVVLVTTSYRLGALGYLCTGDSSSPGNYGPLDQIEALKWVQKNIRYFGGDPNRVVVFGESAGAASVSYLPLYPGAKGLFHGGISESGSSVAVWGFQRDPMGKAVELAQLLSCPYDSSAAIVNCLRTKTASELSLASNKMRGPDAFGLPFVPCAEDPHKGLFLRGNPVELFAQGKFLKVPMITGTNRDEGATALVRFPAEIDDNFLDTQLPIWVYNLTKYNNINAITDVVRDQYFKGIDTNDQPAEIQALIDLITDSWFISAAHLNAQLLTSHGVKTYVYSFEYQNANQPYVVHGQELSFIFGSSPLSPQDQQMSDTLTGMWVNFASSLNPSETWEPTPFARDLSYLKITNNGSSMQKGLRTAKSELWDFNIPIIAGVDDVPLTICKALHFC